MQVTSLIDTCQLNINIFNAIYEVIAPFIPAPLIDKAISLNIKHWLNEEHSDLFFVYFMKD